MTFKPNFFFRLFETHDQWQLTAETKSKQNYFKTPHFQQSKNFNYQSEIIKKTLALIYL